MLETGTLESNFNPSWIKMMLIGFWKTYSKDQCISLSCLLLTSNYLKTFWSVNYYITPKVSDKELNLERKKRPFQRNLNAVNDVNIATLPSF